MKYLVGFVSIIIWLFGIAIITIIGFGKYFDKESRKEYEKKYGFPFKRTMIFGLIMAAWTIFLLEMYEHHYSIMCFVALCVIAWGYFMKKP